MATSTDTSTAINDGKPIRGIDDAEDADSTLPTAKREHCNLDEYAEFKKAKLQEYKDANPSEKEKDVNSCVALGERIKVEYLERAEALRIKNLNSLGEMLCCELLFDEVLL